MVTNILLALLGGAFLAMLYRQFDGIDKKIDGLEGRMNRQFDEMAKQMNQRFDTLESKIDSKITLVKG
jgi:hypothetical protein